MDISRYYCVYFSIAIELLVKAMFKNVYGKLLKTHFVAVFYDAQITVSFFPLSL